MGSGAMFLGHVECALCEAVLDGCQTRFRLRAQDEGWTCEWVQGQEIWRCPRHKKPTLPLTRKVKPWKEERTCDCGNSTTSGMCAECRSEGREG